jgi:protein tyrosine phosphatase
MIDFKYNRMKISTIALIAILLTVFLWSPLSNAYESIRQTHYDRNKYNEVVSYEFAFQNWEKMSDSQSIYHRHGVGNEYNEKFISPDGHSENAYRNHALVKDPANLGTYNFIAPRGFLGNIGHFFEDVLPYWVWGNTPDDATPFWNRVTGP